MKHIVATLALTSLVLAGCTTTDPYSGEQKNTNTTKGAAIGAVAGAVIGATTASKKDRGKGAITGAIAGGAIGGGVGVYMDRQEEELRAQLQNTGVSVVREGDNLRLVMPGNITFASGKSDIQASFYGTLDSVAQVLREYSKTAIRISGHTDSTGGAALNQLLSESRAESIKNYFLQKQIAAARIETIGYSFNRPIASNDTAAGREQNRRVELELIPISSQV